MRPSPLSREGDGILLPRWYMAASFIRIAAKHYCLPPTISPPWVLDLMVWLFFFLKNQEIANVFHGITTKQLREGYTENSAKKAPYVCKIFFCSSVPFAFGTAAPALEADRVRGSRRRRRMGPLGQKGKGGRKNSRREENYPGLKIAKTSLARGRN